MQLLSPEEQGTILMNLFRFQNNEEIILNTPMVKMCWASMEFLLEKDAEMYKKKSANMRAIGKQNKTTPHDIVTAPHDTAKTDNDTAKTDNDTATINNDTTRYRFDNDNDNDNVNVNDNMNGNRGDTRVDTDDTFDNLDIPSPITESYIKSVEYKNLEEPIQSKIIERYLDQ